MAPKADQNTVVDDPSAACCTPVEHTLTPDQVSADLDVLKAMGSQTRYEVLRSIAGADGAVCVCQIEASLDVSQGAVSQSLARLHEGGLLRRRKEGRWRYYDTTDNAESLIDAIEEVRTDE